MSVKIKIDSEEASPLLAIDDESADAVADGERSELKNEVRKDDMTNKPNKASTQVVLDFDIDQFLSNEPKTGGIGTRRRAAFARLIEEARRNADIDSVSTQVTSDMEIAEKAEQIDSLIKESKNECLTILQWSAILDCRKLLPRLLEFGSDTLQLTPNTKKSVAVIAVEFGNGQFAIELLKNCNNKREIISQETAELKSLIEISCYHQQKQLVTFLLDSFKEYYLEDNQGVTQSQKALSTAVKGGFVDIVGKLISKGVPDKNPDTSDEPAIVLAVQLEQLEFIKYLLAVPGCDVNIEDATKDTSLMVAARSEQSKALRILLGNSEVDINKITSTSPHEPKTALSEASKLGRTENVTLLLEKGAKVVNVQEKTCNSLICAAQAQQGSTGGLLVNKFVEEILVKETKVTKTLFEDTLMSLTVNNQSSVLGKLLHHDNFDKCLKMFGGVAILWECLMQASTKGLKSTVLVLLKCSLTPTVTTTRKNNELIDLADRDEIGDTPLHQLASTCLDGEIIQSLGTGSNKEGVNPNWLLIQAVSGKSVLEYISKESVLLEFLGLNYETYDDVGEKDNNPFNIKWEKTKHRDNFKRKHIAVDTKLLTLCFKQFPKAAETILDSVVAAKDCGTHDDNLEIFINWENIQNVEISSESGNCEKQNYSELLTAGYYSQLLSKPLLNKLMHRIFRWQVIWASTLVVIANVMVLGWEGYRDEYPMLKVLIVFGVLSLITNGIQLIANWKHHATCCYNWLQVAVYVFIVIWSLKANHIPCDRGWWAPYEPVYEYYGPWFYYGFLMLIPATWFNWFLCLLRSTGRSKTFIFVYRLIHCLICLWSLLTTEKYIRVSVNVDSGAISSRYKKSDTDHI